MVKSRKAVLGVVSVFALGVLCGILATRLLDNYRIGSGIAGKEQAREEVIVRRLDKRLDLDDRQEKQVRAIVHETHGVVQALRDQLRPQTEAAIEKAQARIMTILTPEQQKEYERMIAERKERIRKKME